MKNLNESYESPQVEIIDVEVEKGFAYSEPTAGGEDANWGY